MRTVQLGNPGKWLEGNVSVGDFWTFTVPVISLPNNTTCKAKFVTVNFQKQSNLLLNPRAGNFDCCIFGTFHKTVIRCAQGVRLPV